MRFDRRQRRAYVSVGFRNAPSLTIEFTGAAGAQYLSAAKYYDNRAACYTLSLDNWGRRATANPGAEWHGADDDRSDNYQAAIHVCRALRLPVSVAINSRMAGGDAMWAAMQQELDRQDSSWEPATHGRTHPGSAKSFQAVGYQPTILGCRDDILEHLRGIPFGHQNSVIHDARPSRDGEQGSTLLEHLKRVAQRKDLWYAANGWLYCYRWVAENAIVSPR